MLGLRLVKKTVNFDDPSTYHLYFGDEGGKPGTIITFFPWANARQGKIGDGQVGVTSYVIPVGTMDFWEKRLRKFNVSFTKTERFGEQYLEFDDPHGLHLEMVEREEGEGNTRSFGEVLSDVAIKGFGGATLLSKQPEKTAKLLETVMGLKRVGKEGDFIRFRSSSDIGNIIDLKVTTVGSGQMGVGTVHHIAWRASDEEDLQRWRRLLLSKSYDPTEILDRNYFKALYFQEEGGILFEIATDSPSFAVDERLDELGQKLMLPAWLESKRDELERMLPHVKVRVLEEDNE